METTTKTSSLLSYQMTARLPYLVITFSGPLSKQSEEILDKCWEDVQRHKAQYVILNMQAASGLERPFVAALVKMQKRIRDQGIVLRICDLDLALHKELVELGAVRHAELRETLADTLKGLLLEAGQVKVA